MSKRHPRRSGRDRHEHEQVPLAPFSAAAATESGLSEDEQAHYARLAELEESEGGISSGGVSYWGAEASEYGRRLIEEALKSDDSGDRTPAPNGN